MAGPKILSLFSGVGGLEVAVGLALRGSLVVGYVERDSYAAAALMARMEESSMDLAPVFCGEIQDLDGRELCGHVDVVCGGIPCQPYSLAGQHRGDEDDRALWHEFARIVGECEPSLVFIENVPTFVTRSGFRPLGEELCRMGFEIADPFFIGAGDLGAPHVRKRVFILAHRDRDRRKVFRSRSEPDSRERAPQRDDADGCDQRLADAGAPGLQGGKFSAILCARRGGKRRAATELRDAQGWTLGERGVPDSVGDEVRDEPERGGGPAREAERGYPVAGDVGIFPPGPDDERGWGEVFGVAPHLIPAIEPGLRVMVDGVSVVLDESRADQLRCAGNAVVVAQAYVAFRQLLQWIEKGEEHEG